MTLRKKSFIIITITATVTVFLISLSAYLVINDRYTALETDNTQVAVNRVQQAITSLTKTLVNTTADWANWDDSYNYLLNPEQTFVDENFSLDSLIAIDVNTIIFVNLSGEVVYAHSVDLTNPERADFIPKPENWLYNNPKLLSLTEKDTVSGFIQIPQGALLVASAPSLRSDFQGSSAGKIIFGRLFDEQLINSLSSLTNTSLKLLPVTPSDNDMEITDILHQFEQGVEIPIKKFGNQSIAGYALLLDPQGNPTYLLKAILPRSIFDQGTTMFRYALIVLIGIGLFEIIATSILFDLIFLKRLSHLSKNLNHIISLKKAGARLAPDTQQDEIGSLTTSFNSMLDNMQGIEANYQTLVENQGEGVVIVDPDDIISFTNPVAEILLTDNRGSLVGRDLKEYVSEADKLTIAKETEKRRKGESSSYEIQVHHANGVITHVLITATPRLDDQGNFIGTYGIFRDISSIKKAQEILLESESRFRSLVEQSVVGIFLLDEGGKVIEWNTALVEMTGYGKPAFLGKSYSSLDEIILYPNRKRVLLHGVTFDEFAKKIQGNGNGSSFTRVKYDLILLAKDGRELNIEVVFFPIDTKSGRRFGGMVIDKTEQTRMIEEDRNHRTYIEALRDSAEALNSTLDFESLLDRIIENVGRVFPNDTAAVLLLDGDLLKVVRSKGYKEKGLPDITESSPFKLNVMQNMAWMAETGQPLSISDIRKYAGWNPLPENNWVRSYIGMPLIVRKHIIGFISLFSATVNFYTDEYAKRLSGFANQTAIAVENARLYAEIQQKADTDELTGLRNRRSFYDLGAREVERAIRFGHPLTAMMIDLDNFKIVNDTYGHSVGDELLKLLADVFRKNLRNVDLIARYGGDEFVALLPENNLESAGEVANRLLKSISDAYVDTPQGRAAVTASIGVSGLFGRVINLPALIEQADRALYQGKQQGRARVVIAPTNTDRNWSK